MVFWSLKKTRKSVCTLFTTVCNSSLTYSTYKPSHRSHSIIPLSNHHTKIIPKSHNLRNICLYVCSFVFFFFFFFFLLLLLLLLLKLFVSKRSTKREKSNGETFAPFFSFFSLFFLAAVMKFNLTGCLEKQTKNERTEREFFLSFLSSEIITSERAPEARSS